MSDTRQHRQRILPSARCMDANGEDSRHLSNRVGNSIRSLIDMAADRGAFIDQSQSLNLFTQSPNIGKLSSMYMYAWKKGLKTTYYLRSRSCHGNPQDHGTSLGLPKNLILVQYPPRF